MQNFILLKEGLKEGGGIVLLRVGRDPPFFYNFFPFCCGFLISGLSSVEKESKGLLQRVNRTHHWVLCFPISMEKEVYH